MKRAAPVAHGSVVDAAGHVLASWASREAILRQEARTDWPTHVQYAGAGRLAILCDGEELAWHLPEVIPVASA